MKSKLESLKSKIIGQVGVDSGLIWIGDPCYILHKKNKLPKTLGKSWDEFCDIINNKYINSFNFEMGHEGLGVCTSTKYGDGVYNVIGFFKEDSERPSCVMVDFDSIL